MHSKSCVIDSFLAVNNYSSLYMSAESLASGLATVNTSLNTHNSDTWQLTSTCPNSCPPLNYDVSLNCADKLVYLPAGQVSVVVGGGVCLA